MATNNVLNAPIPFTETKGGTAQTTYSYGDMLYATASDTLSKLPISPFAYPGDVLCIDYNNGLPSWENNITYLTNVVTTAYASTLTGGNTANILTCNLVNGTKLKGILTTGTPPSPDAALVVKVSVLMTGTGTLGTGNLTYWVGTDQIANTALSDNTITVPSTGTLVGFTCDIPVYVSDIQDNTNTQLIVKLQNNYAGTYALTMVSYNNLAPVQYYPFGFVA